MTTLLSRSDTVSVSSAAATWPPTRASPSGTACTAVRSRSITRLAASESGDTARTASIRTHRPSAEATGGCTDATPSTLRAASATAPAAGAAARISAGCDVPLA
jgi:hypothetical protein